MSSVFVKHVDVLDDEAMIDVKLYRFETRPGEPYLRAGEFRISWGDARSLYQALGLVLNHHEREVRL